VFRPEVKVEDSPEVAKNLFWSPEMALNDQSKGGKSSSLDIFFRISGKKGMFSVAQPTQAKFAQPLKR